MALLRAASVAGAVIGVAMLAVAIGTWQPAALAETPAPMLPTPAIDAPASKPGLQTAIFSGGCFWGVQAVFQHVGGVTKAVSGYTGGTVTNPSYQQVSGGGTGHAESVQVTFDPAKISYGKLLQIFFTVALDPTQVNRQGPDHGTQYRSELFVASPDQDRIAHAYLAQLEAAHVFNAPIATRIDPATKFYPAEAYHQNYLLLHPDQPYIAFNDMPKVHHLQTAFPDNWRDDPVKVAAAN
jgi:peptide-methionine (S)-S-oxide reductase